MKNCIKNKTIQRKYRKRQIKNSEIIAQEYYFARPLR